MRKINRKNKPHEEALLDWAKAQRADIRVVELDVISDDSVEADPNNPNKPEQVAEAIVKLVEMPNCTRPLRTFDLILDGTGGETLRNSFSCLAPFGRLINFGNASGGSTSVDAFTLINNNRILQGFGLVSYLAKPDLMQEAYQYLFSQATTGKLKV